MLNFIDLAFATFLFSILSLLVDQQRLSNDADIISKSLALAARLNYNSKCPTSPDTTVIILNWSRLPNVVQIASLLCQNLLNDVVDSVFIWNNSPKSLTEEDFASAKCPPRKLRIHNSPFNLYFQARFIACARSVTRYCFIQDDDYLVLPEVIRTLRYRISEARIPGIYLLPAHEMLSSQLRTVRVDDAILTSFAWLGHGAIIKRDRAIKFLLLLKRLNLTEDEFKMADNYFAILSNTLAETWFDQGIELGGGQPFTVGVEGDERNNRHIRRAGELLDSIALAKESDSNMPYISRTAPSHFLRLSRSPCREIVCLFETSIELLPRFIQPDTSSAKNILKLETSHLLALGLEGRRFYSDFPPSHAVDGRADTAFRSPQNARKGDWISIDMFGSIPMGVECQLVLIIYAATKAILHASTVEASSDKITWMPVDCSFFCTNTMLNTSLHPQQECRCSVLSVYGGARAFRIRVEHNVDVRWVLYEIWLEGTSY
ncbi:hypothetical protein BDQ12DRAFT_645075 [Crucibulum laeve]|uniref:Uncharacterized protein n=1 Tax=Crucibulum laeve TaxID=68775 RepID=A0A5C3MB27_9AGAR|nr:hypothetical protein BDQ12DRAFT_645075 [Crucibulum laeve]